MTSMTFAENIFICLSGLVFIFLIIFVKNINWKKFGFAPHKFTAGWWQVLLFNILVFVSVQLAIYTKFINLPEWVLDKDPILPLFAITFFQEILFRSLIINYFEKFGEKKALWISIAIFVLFHLIAPYTWTTTGVIFAGLTFIAGYFWGQHFLKFRNIYLISVSHFLINLSFNYILFT